MTAPRALAVVATTAALALLTGCGETVAGARTSEVSASGVKTPVDATTSDPFEHHLLDCDGGRSTIWTTDPSTPPPGQTLEAALERHPGAEVVREGETSALAVVRTDGRVVETLVLARWAGETGSWFVESGAECRRR